MNLERQGYVVLLTYSGEEALRQLGSLPDLIVVDSKLPDMTGRELIARIRAMPGTEGVRIILMGDKEDRDSLPPDGCGPDDPSRPDMFLTKPFDPMLLISA